MSLKSLKQIMNIQKMPKTKPLVVSNMVMWGNKAEDKKKGKVEKNNEND